MGYLALGAAVGLWAALRAVREAGALVPPLDDAYIYLQYARTAGEGHFLAYQPGAEPTRGATSLLYLLVLAPFAALLPPQGAVWASWALGCLFLGGTAWAADRWARRVLGPAAGAAAGLLTLASGHFAWGALSGMDAGLFAFLLLAALAAQARLGDAAGPADGRRRVRTLGALLFLVSLARPEGMLLGLVVAGFAAAGPGPREKRWLWAAPLAGIAVTAAVSLLATGRLAANALEAKAVWIEPRPDARAEAFRRLPAALGRILESTFTDLRSDAYGFGTRFALRALLAGGAALGALAAVRRGAGPAARALLAVLAAGLLAGLVPKEFHLHHFRYQAPYLPLVLCLAVSGWWWAARRAPRARPALWVALGVLLLPGLARMMDLYGRNAADIQGLHVRMGRWIHDTLPPDAVVGINDAGAIAWYGERRVVDLVGLVTDGSALPNQSGPASVYEWLESLPEDRRPTHFAVFPAWSPYLVRTSLFGPRLVEFALAENTIAGADRKALYAADWTAAGDDARPVHRRPLLDAWGFRVVDAVDVADVADEARHDYRVQGTWTSTLREFAYAPGGPARIDGGRRVAGGESFRLACRPREPAALVLRTEAFLPFAVEVAVDGTPAGRWEVPAAPTRWSEPLFELPPDLLTTDTVRITVRAVGEPPAAYAAYQYWLLQ